ncbi:MAG: FAD-dependent oxidoreductase [Nanoarchaeota archaeon]
MNYDVAVLGAGIAGLTACLELCRNGKKVILIEKENDVGGLCRSFEYKDFTLDYGPHLLFLHRKETSDFIQSLNFSDQIYSKKLNHSLWYNGKLYDYTKNMDRLRLTFHFKRVPLFLARIFLLKREPKEKNAEEWLIKNLGRKSYENFFKPILYKRFRIDVKKLNPITLNWIIKRFVKYGFKGDEAYVKGGMGKFPLRISEEIKKLGGEIATNTTVNKIAKQKDFFEISFKDKKIKTKAVMSAMPPKDFSSISNIKLPEIKYLHSMFIFFGIEEKTLFGNFDIIFPDKCFWFQRVYEPTTMYEKTSNGSVICADKYFNEIPKDTEKEKEKCIEGMNRLIPNFEEKIKWSLVVPYQNSFALSKKIENLPNGLFVIGQSSVEEEIFPSIDELIKRAIETSKEVNNYLESL